MAISDYTATGYALGLPEDRGDYVALTLRQPPSGKRPMQNLEIRCDGGLADHVYESVNPGDSLIVIGRLDTVHGPDGDRIVVTAGNVGHDLRFGTSSFRKTPKDTATKQGGNRK